MIILIYININAHVLLIGYELNASIYMARKVRKRYRLLPPDARKMRVKEGGREEPSNGSDIADKKSCANNKQ